MQAEQTATEPTEAPGIGIARRVIGCEAAALDALASSIGPSFGSALELLEAIRGRVIVTGMGKSGHVARKIAATFASTGTPAHFVHPAEASHGDLGMLMRGDAVIALSNSGETPELAHVIAHTRRFAIPLIGISSRPASALMRQADVGLVLPVAAEACGTGIVPTVSTTMMLALGDALAVALMEARAFTPGDFHAIHPGGTLGARLKRVADLMHGGAAMPLVPEAMPMPEVLLAITRKGFGVAGVTDGAGRLAGIVTDGDLRRHMAGLMALGAADVMTRGPATVAPDALAETALAAMNERRITCLFVTNPVHRIPLGIIHIHDCLRAGIA